MRFQQLRTAQMSSTWPWCAFCSLMECLRSQQHLLPQQRIGRTTAYAEGFTCYKSTDAGLTLSMCPLIMQALSLALPPPCPTCCHHPSKAPGVLS